MVAPLLEVSGVHKRFGATLALEGVELQVAAGEVHALLGENGAGKSTLMNILFGALTPDTGSLTLAGQPYVPKSPAEARSLGVSMVQQEPMLCLHQTVEENVLLGCEPQRWGLLRRREGRRLAERALRLVVPDAANSPVRPERLARDLSPSDRQLVALARALATTECRLLILDEPTSSLTEDDVGRLFRVLDNLRSQGIGIVYISHFLEEVRRIADRFTVLRDGKSVGNGDARATGEDELVRLMVGREVKELFTRSQRTPGECVLSAVDVAGVSLSGAPVLRRASFELRQGEVLGIAGLVGAGRSELMRALFGLAKVQSGQVRLKAQVGPHSPAQRWAAGAGFLSEDRKGEGLAANLSVAENLTLTRLSSHGRFGFVSPRSLRESASRFVKTVGIRARDASTPVRELSGGNQQKVALARLLHHEADVLLLDEPTRGIDVQSRAEIYKLIDRLTQEGKAVLMVSSYLPELLGVCDRVAVMRRGELGPARDVGELTQDTLLREAIG